MKKLFVVLIQLYLALGLSAQVTPQTGSATFSLPMFNWTDDKSRLTSVVALNYSSGNGLKVNEVASNVGQGWNLIAGGVISRMTVGLPDDQLERNTSELRRYPPGYLYDPNSAAEGCPGGLLRYPVYKDKNHLYKQHNFVGADKELDYFSFQLNGRSGLFVLGKNYNDACAFIGDTKMKGWYEREDMRSQGIRTTIKAFYIQDENGSIFKFTKFETTKVTKFSYTDANQIAYQAQPKFKGGKVYYEAAFNDNTVDEPYIINSWYLTEVEDALTHRVINFQYDSQNWNISINAGVSLNYYSQKDYSVVSRSTSRTSTPVLNKIIYPDQHEVIFNYGSTRTDLPGARAVASIEVKYKTRYISKYELGTSYFIQNRYGTPVTDFQIRSARLCLVSLKKYGVDLKADEQPYEFDYYLGSGGDDMVPPPFFFAKDIWGYYNGNNSRDYDGNIIPLTTLDNHLSNTQIKGLCYLRNGLNGITLNAKQGYAKNGLLKKIKYPTGGALTYEYEQNTFTLNNILTDVSGVHVSKTIVTDGGFSNDCGNGLVTNYSYTLPASEATSLWGVEMPLNSMTVYNHYEPEDKYFYYRPILSFGCDYRYQYPGILSREQGISLTSGQQFMVTLSKVMDIVSGILTIVDIINVSLVGTPANWVAVIIDIIASLVTVGISCLSDLAKDETTTVYYNSDLKAMNPLPMQFRHVKITEGTGTNGRTEMSFTSKFDGTVYEIWEPTNPEMSMKQRFAYWAYGLPKVTTIYNFENKKVRETENIYDEGAIEKSFPVCVKCPISTGFTFVSCKCLVVQSTSQRSDLWSDPNHYMPTVTPNFTDENNDPDKMLLKFYYMRTGRMQLNQVLERTYKPNNDLQYLETSTRYYYNSDNLQVNRIETVNSNGDEISTLYQYNNEFMSVPVLHTLADKNILSVPIVTTKKISNSGSQAKTLHTTVTEYTTISNGDIRPSKILEKTYDQPTIGGSYYYGPGHPSNGPGFREIQNFTYDASSNLVGVKDEGNRLLSSIYGYSDKYVVASVINADPILDKSAYSSFESEKLGGWNLTGTALVVSPGVTGSKAFQLNGSNSLTASLNSSKGYRLSFWATNTVSISGNPTLIKSEPTNNGFTYYEFIVSQGTSSVTVSGNAIIDELRIYPQLARMRTVTFDPLVGKTSEADENNRITYYEYDALGRLSLIKDEKRNIVKMNEYNTAIKASPCVITYYNKAISEVFTRNNCSIGSKGEDYIYTIPANKYSSTVSQFLVDKMAELELLVSGQTTANNSVGCVTMYTNDEFSQTLTKQGCDIGYKGTNYTYVVPMGKYTATSKLEANELAQFELDANAQAFANLPGNASCIIDTAGVWIGTGYEKCDNGHKWAQVQDKNPNSPNYLQYMFIDMGQDAQSCPIPVCQNCTGRGLKCMSNGVCEVGIKVYTESVWDNYNNYWHCYYHYEFSDMSVSETYDEIQPGINCIAIID